MPPRIPRPLISRLTTTNPPYIRLSILPPTSRAFTTTTPLPGRASKEKLTQLLAKAPPYPYKIKPTFKQSWFGLYASKHVQFGNNIPNKKYIITRRRWYPNIKYKKLWSFGLGEWVTCKLATNVLRTIDKVGGLDNYLLSEKPARLKELGPWGWELRYRLQCTKSVQRKYQAERLALGLITRERMLKENVQMGIAKGVQEEEKTYRKAPTKEEARQKTFLERWKNTSEAKKVLFGEPWRSRRYEKKETAREQKTKLDLEKKRLTRAEAVMARQKAQRAVQKAIEKEKARIEEEEKMEKLSKTTAARRDVGPTPRTPAPQEPVPQEPQATKL
ncbi:hypothetical protein ABW20_dc0100805 [Dactylellina cionopaga]|nr:hypothetical protein ABW20_dc0100805 [Dactylellina cionopaga]